MTDNQPTLNKAQDFQPLTTKRLAEVLGLTIKRDDTNKVVTFLAELSAYTDESQFNISFNAPSSTGKSFIPTEIARLFPEEDVRELGYCTPAAFFHDYGELDKEKHTITIDFSHKILIFLDQPHSGLLSRLRPLLSHDKKQIMVKITDKNEKGGLRTKNVILSGFPAVIFCTASLKNDEQEATRFLLLSPEIHQEKIREGILQTIRKEADDDKYAEWLNADPGRISLKQRIVAIKEEGVSKIIIPNQDVIVDRFFKRGMKMKPRHQRDVKRLIALIKCHALLNLWWRERDGDTISANEDDIESGFAIWDIVSVSQELNLPPYVYHIFDDVILPAWFEKNPPSTGGEPAAYEPGLERRDILKKHFDVYGRMLDGVQLRQQILPMLETAGLIYQEADADDKRRVLIYPADQFKEQAQKKYSVDDPGVNEDIDVSGVRIATKNEQR